MPVRPRCAAVTDRHIPANPPVSRASSVTRGASSSSHCGPRLGRPSRASLLLPRRDTDQPGRGWAGSVTGSSARSVPNTGTIPSAAAAFANRTAPYSPSRSVTATWVIPDAAAAAASSRGRITPSRSEYPVRAVRCAKGGTSPPDSPRARTRLTTSSAASPARRTS